ncbi:hypothetical protein D9M71_494780 [compost metagenome]
MSRLLSSRLRPTPASSVTVFSVFSRPIIEAKSSVFDSLLVVTPSNGRASSFSAWIRMLATSRSTSAASSLRPLLTSLSRVRDNFPKCCDAVSSGVR